MPSATTGPDKLIPKHVIDKCRGLGVHARKPIPLCGEIYVLLWCLLVPATLLISLPPPALLSQCSHSLRLQAWLSGNRTWW